MTTPIFSLIRSAALPLDIVPKLLVDDTSLCSLVDEQVLEALEISAPGLLDRYLENPKDTQVKRSITKYLLRMACRSTPFGAMASFAPCEHVEGWVPLLAIQKPSLKLDLDTSWIIKQLEDYAVSSAGIGELTWRVNSTADLREGWVRFVTYSRINQGGAREYSLKRIARTTFIDWALLALDTPLTLEEIGAKISKKFGAVPGELNSTLRKLVESQFLVSDHHICPTEGSILQAAVSRLPNGSLQRRLSSLVNLLQTANSKGLRGANEIRSLRESIGDIAGQPLQFKYGIRADLFTREQVHIGRNWTTLLERAASVAKLMRRPRRVTLKEAARRFAQCFGDSRIPLLRAVDPGSIASPIQIKQALPEIRALNLDRDDPKVPYQYTALEEHLRRELLLSMAIDNWHIDLSSKPLRHFIQEWDTPYFSVTCSFFTEKAISRVELRSSHQQPERLIGRFTKQLPNIKDKIAEMCAPLSDLVADISHIPQDRTGNIADRNTSLKFEIGIRSGVRSGSQELRLGDLLLGVRNEKFYLWHSRLNCELSVVMTNAHNYNSYGQLPVYRFLNELSNSSISSRPIQITQILPEHVRLPELSIDGVLYSKQQWSFSKTLLEPVLRALSNADRVTAMRSLLDIWQVSPCVWLVQGDKTLVLMARKDLHTEILVEAAFEDKELILRECVMERLNTPVVMESMPRQHEIVSVFPSFVEKRNISNEDSFDIAHTPWLSYVVRITWVDQNNFLRALAKGFDNQKIERWFFIRYADEVSAHLRVRAVIDHSEAQKIFQKLKGDFDFKLELVEYVPELKRYGGSEGLAACEELFVHSSRITIDNFGGDQIPRLLADFTSMLQIWFSTPREMFSFADSQSQSFSREFKLTGHLRREVLKLGNVDVGFDVARLEPPRASVDCIKGLPDEKFQRAVRGIFHMHANRVCARQARACELVVWLSLRQRLYSAISFGKAVNGT